MEYFSSSTWSLPDSSRMHPRLAAELLLDVMEYDEEPRSLIKLLRGKGFDADMLRVKGYVNQKQGYVVCILPMCSHDMQSVASMSVRKNIADESDTYISASATIVKTSQATNPHEFQVFTFENGKLKESKPVDFELLRKGGAKLAFKKMFKGEKIERFDRLTKGRALSGVVLNDFATDEVKLGFLSKSEYNKVIGDSDLYSEISRIHSYVATASVAGGCKGCCSTSTYACSSCSCNFEISIETKVGLEPVTS